MFKTGSKFLFGLAAFGFAAAFLYADGTGQHTLGMDSIVGPITLGYKGYVGDHVGYTIFIGLALAALFGGIFLAALRDADPDAVAEVADTDTVPEVPAPATANYWPVMAAFSVACIAIGLAVGPTLFVIGLVVAGATTVEWAVRAWSDRATGDPEVNRAIRDRLLQPVEIPVLAVVGVAGMVLAISRILLALPPTGKYAVFLVVPVVFLGIGALVAYRPKLSPSIVAGLLIVGGIAILAGGVAAGIHGTHEEKDSGHEKGKGEQGLAPMPAPALTVIRVGR